MHFQMYYLCAENGDVAQVSCIDMLKDTVKPALVTTCIKW